MTVVSERIAIENGKVVGVANLSKAEQPKSDVVHHCPRCGSYFYGRFEGFDGNPFFCGHCGFTYPTVSLEALREMHRKNGTLSSFDKGELVEDVGTVEITASEE